MFNTNTKLTLCVVLLCLTLSAGSPVEGTNATILVFGRSGSGVSSTVRMLLGNLTLAIETETGYSNSPGNKSVITEYVIPIRGYPLSFLKIVDVDGVTDDKLPEDDAYIQASLKTYLKHPQGLYSQEPTAVLIVSPFDDNRYDDDQSLYVKMLRRITDVERSVYPNSFPDINILIFTRLMTETKQFQRSPSSKLESLKAAAIERVRGLSPEISLIVGENKGEEHGLTLNENGTYKLPNHEFYPENVLDAVASLAAKNGKSEDLRIIENFAQFRFNTNAYSRRFSVSRAPFTIFPDSNDVVYFIRSIVRSGKGEIYDNEVNSALQLTYEGLLDANLKTRTADKVPRLQTFLQSSNITKFSDLPSTGLEKVKFFQSLPTAIEQDVVSILEKALNLTMPPFTQSLTVGHGYDVLKDEILPPTSVPFSPVSFDTWKFSGMGYLLPSFLSCSQLPQTQFKTYMYFTDSFKKSVAQRQTYLDYPDKDAFNISNFDGQLRLGFNIMPSKNDVPALSSVKEIRTHKMQLNDRIEFSEEFKESVGLLSPFNSSDRESEKQWRSFFEKWGTHVVSGFVGGFIQGTVISENILWTYQNESHVQHVLEQIVNFTKVEMDGGVTFYGVFEGDKDPKLANVHELPLEERNQILNEWEASLSYEPVVLNYQMDLLPISFLVGHVNQTKGTAAKIALDLFLQGNLKYQRARRPQTSTGRPYWMDTKSTTPGIISSSVFSYQTPSVRPTSPTTTYETPIPTRPFLEQPNKTGIRNSSLPRQDTEEKIQHPSFAPVSNNDTDICEAIPRNDTHHSLLASWICKWVNGNKHKLQVLESYHRASAAAREKEREGYEEAARRRTEVLENERQRKEDYERKLDEIRKEAEKERKIDREKQDHLNKQQREKWEEERTQRLLEFEKEVKEANRKILETMRQQKEADEEDKRSKSWLWVKQVYKFAENGGKYVGTTVKSIYVYVAENVKTIVTNIMS